MKKIIFATIFFISILFIPSLVFSSEDGVYGQHKVQSGAFKGEKGLDAEGASEDPRLVIAYIIEWAMTIIGTLFLLYGIYGGFLILTSEGESDKIETGKSTVLTATIGVIVALSAYSITLFVTSGLWGASGADSDCDPEKEFCHSGNIRVEEETEPQKDPLGSPPRDGDVWYKW